MWKYCLFMDGFVKNYVLFFVAIVFGLIPVQLLADQQTPKNDEAVGNIATQQSGTSIQKTYLAKKSSRVKKRRSSRAVRIKLRRQRAAKQKSIELGENYDGSGVLQLASNVALIINQDSGDVIYSKNITRRSPIASITKLMTAMIVLDAQLPLDEEVIISAQDVDTIKGTRSRLQVGASLSRGDMLQLALMASENRAAYALASNYPGGQLAFIAAMNEKASLLGLNSTKFAGPTGLDSGNISTAADLAILVQTAYQYPEIRWATTSPSYEVYVEGQQASINFKNTNSLVREDEWEIGLSKTGFISEAGRCLVMQTIISGQPMILVFLDSSGRYNRIGDANRVRKWMEYNNAIETANGKIDAIEVVEEPTKVVSGTVS
jgi:D-alanyl-D-alanine endopeptidase (penicillin-binding protein 7)